MDRESYVNIISCFFKLLKTITYILLVSIIVVSCSTSSRISNTTYTSSLKSSNAIPKEIGEDNYVLLIQKLGLRRADRLFAKHLSDHYRGEVEEIYFPEIENQEGYKLRKSPSLGKSEYFISVDPYFEGKYSDERKYRFFLGIDYRILINKSENGWPDMWDEQKEAANRTHIWYDFTFYILDRQTGRKYICPEESAWFSPLFEGYIRAIEKVRKTGG